MPDFSLTDLREDAPQASQGTASQATAETASQVSAPEASHAGASAAAAMDGAATGYNAVTGDVDPETMTSAGQLTEITKTDSPLMRRAKQEGLLTAGQRGLGNSSIAAGAAMGSMVDRASPLAAQDAQTYFQNMRANVESQNRASEVSTGRETDVAMANADAQNRISALNAQLETAVSQQNAEAENSIKQQISELNASIDMRNAELQTNVSQGNAEMESQVSMQNAQEQNELNRTALVGNQELNRQFLAGEQAVDLAAIQARYSAVISANETAAQMYNAHLTGLSSLMANPDVRPSRIAEYTRTMTSQLEGGLAFIDEINSIDFETGVSTAGGTGSGANYPTGPAPEPTGQTNPYEGIDVTGIGTY